MSQDPKAGPDGDNLDKLSTDDKLSKILESRWDASKMSQFMRASKASSGQRLSAHDRNRFEGRLGVDLSDVRIFSGELAETITRAHNAEALTVGDTGMILMRGSSKFAPGTPQGTSLLAHELTHVAQFRPSALARKTEGGSALADEDEEEAEAQEEEARTLAEEMGEVKPPPSESGADKENKDKDRKEKIKEKVLELMREEGLDQELRVGISSYNDWVR